MRVTNNMISNQTLFNMKRALNDFLGLQENMTTGRKVNRPSDDPIGLQRTMNYRSTLSRIQQYRSNISQGVTLLSTYENSFLDMGNLVRSAVDVALAATDDTNNSPEALPTWYNEVKTALDRIMELSGQELDGRKIFSGHRTSTSPLVAGANGYRYAGDFGVKNIEVDGKTTSGINFNAAEVLLKQINLIGENADLKVGVAGTTLVSDLLGGTGLDLNTINVRDNVMGINVTVDLNVPAAPVTVNDVLSRINTQLTAAGITNVIAKIGADSNVILEATPNGQISLQTELQTLNGGAGVNLQPPAIRVHNPSNSIDVQIDLSGASTIGDVVSAFNNQIVGAGINNVFAAINGAGNGIEISDINGVPLQLSISEVGIDAQVAQNLGIKGSISPTLVGQPLNPTTDFTITEGAGQTATQLGLVGDMTVSMVGIDLAERLTLTTPISRLNNGLGYNLGDIRISQGTRSVTLNMGDTAFTTVGDLINALNTSGLNITASINRAETGIQISNDLQTESLLVENLGSTKTADDMGIYGAADIMAAMVLLRNELNQPAGTQSIPTRVQRALTVLQIGSESLNGLRGDVGSRQTRLQAADSRLSTADFETTKLLAEIEDADITDLVTRLATHENNYQAGLIATAKIIQPSLMDFLR